MSVIAVCKLWKCATLANACLDWILKEKNELGSKAGFPLTVARSDFFFCLMSSLLELIKTLFNSHNRMSLQAKKIVYSGKPA